MHTTTPTDSIILAILAVYHLPGEIYLIATSGKDMLTKFPSHVNAHIQRVSLAGLHAQSVMVASHVEIALSPRKLAPIARQAGE